MRTIPDDLSDALAGAATTLCACWRITRRDGHILGFTEHDRDLVFDGTTFEAAAGMTATDIRESVGLSVDNLEVESALTSGRLSADDLEAGLYDDARVEIFRVDWSAPAAHLLLKVGTIGDVKRSGHLFTAEVRGLSHYLQQPRGRLFQHACDATLGDRRCGVDLAQAERRWTGVLHASPEPHRVLCTMAVGPPDGLLTRGLLEIVGGSLAGVSIEIKRHRIVDGHAELTLWQALPAGLAVGDALRLTVGCDKHITTCRDRFANVVNFRGFPHMPGNDFVTSMARAGEPVTAGASQ